MQPPADFQPKAQLLHLTTYGVDFVVVGGIAATLYGSPRDTFDLDICPSQDPGNLDALGRALADMDARLRGVEEDVPFVPDARTLRGVELLTLETRFGALDVLIRPDGWPPYAQLRRRATRLDVGPAAVLVASIDDLLTMKGIADRDKDRADIAELKAIKRLRRRLAITE
jgi:hypothetical protein